MLETFRNAWKIEDLRKRLLFTLLILVLFRLGCALPVPYISAGALTSMFAGGPVRAVLECAGIKDIRTKSLRSNNPINVTAATFAGLCGLTDAESVAAKRGKTVAEILG